MINMIDQDKLKRMSRVLTMIEEDIGEDVKYYEGKEFNGKNVAEMYGRLSACVAALTQIVKTVVKDQIND